MSTQETYRYEMPKELIAEWRNYSVPVTVAQLDPDGFIADMQTASAVLRAFFAQLDDREIDALYESKRAGALGEAAGEFGDTPREAAERERWAVIRTWNTCTTMGECVLAEDSLGRIWGIIDDNGPLAIELVGYAHAEVIES